jgi:hypothetical protein
VAHGKIPRKRIGLTGDEIEKPVKLPGPVIPANAAIPHLMAAANELASGLRRSEDVLRRHQGCSG